MKKSENQTKKREPILVREVAEMEIEKWFDLKMLDPDQRDNVNEITEKDENKETLIRGFMWGYLTLEPDSGMITQKLKFPLKNESGLTTLDSLNYKYRLNQKQVKDSSIGLKARDIEGKVAAYIAALTDQSRSIINLLDTEDRKIADAIVTYFL